MGQLTRLEEEKKTFSYLWALVRASYFFIAMPKPCACQSSRWNLLLANTYKLAKATLGVPTNDSNTPSYTPAVLHKPTLAPSLPLASVELVAKYTNTDLQKAIKLALKLFVQGQQQVQSQMAPSLLKP